MLTLYKKNSSFINALVISILFCIITIFNIHTFFNTLTIIVTYSPNNNASDSVLFFDTGNGYNETNKIKLTHIGHKSIGQVKLYDTVNVRMDNIQQNFAVENIKIYTNNYNININSSDITQYFDLGNYKNIEQRDNLLYMYPSNDDPALFGNSRLAKEIASSKDKIYTKLIIFYILSIILSSIIFIFTFLLFKKISSKENIEKYINILFSLLIFLISWAVVGHSTLQYDFWDDAYQTIAPSFYSSIYAYVIDTYSHWNGRVFTNYINAFLLKYGFQYWLVLNTIILSMLFIYIGKLVSVILNRKYYALYSMAALIIFYLTESTTIWQGALWHSGSTNYLWGIMPGIAVLYYGYKTCINNEKINKLYFIFLIPFGLIAGNIEQTGLITFTFLSIFIIYYAVKYRKINIMSVILFFIFISLLINLLCPGSKIRYAYEMTTAAPNFDNFSYVVKLFYGYIYTILHFFFYQIYFITLLFTLMCIYYFWQRNSMLKWLSVLLLCYMILEKVVVKIYPSFLFQTIAYNMGAASIYQLIFVLFGTIALILITVFLINIFLDNKLLLIKTMLIYLSSIFSALILSFSPGKFVSGSRIFFVPDMMFIIVFLICLGYIFSNRIGLFILNKLKLV